VVRYLDDSLEWLLSSMLNEPDRPRREKRNVYADEFGGENAVRREVNAKTSPFTARNLAVGLASGGRRRLKSGVDGCLQFVIAFGVYATAVDEQAWSSLHSEFHSIGNVTLNHLSEFS